MILGAGGGLPAHQHRMPPVPHGILRRLSLGKAQKADRGAQRGQIRAGLRLGIALTPPDAVFPDIGQETRLLRGIAIGKDDRPDHGDAEIYRRRGIGRDVSLFEQIAARR